MLCVILLPHILLIVILIIYGKSRISARLRIFLGVTPVLVAIKICGLQYSNYDCVLVKKWKCICIHIYNIENVLKGKGNELTACISLYNYMKIVTIPVIFTFRQDFIEISLDIANLLY